MKLIENNGRPLFVELDRSDLRESSKNKELSEISTWDIVINHKSYYTQDVLNRSLYVQIKDNDECRVLKNRITSNPFIK